MSRAQQREFGTVPFGTRASPAPDLSTYSSIRISTELNTFFKQQLYSPSRVRGGLLFGRVVDDVLFLLVASTAGLSTWYPPGVRAVLDIDPRFAVGWSEALTAVLGTKVIWVGNWVAHGDGQLRSEGRDLKRFKRAFSSGLADDRHMLLVVGWEDGKFQRRLYLGDIEHPPALFSDDLLVTEQSVQSVLKGE